MANLRRRAFLMVVAGTMAASCGTVSERAEPATPKAVTLSVEGMT
jgi:hypothetical protein